MVPEAALLKKRGNERANHDWESNIESGLCHVKGEERASLPLLAAVFHTLDVSANRLPCRGVRACGWTTGRSSEVGVERGRDDDLWMRGARTGWKRHRAETETGERPETERDK